MLTNLVFNAADALPKGGRIVIRTWNDGKALFPQVEDSGQGMTPEVRERCLEPFFTTKGKYGSGLGLAMVHGIVQKHRGSSDIRSEPGCGSIFTFCFPLS